MRIVEFRAFHVRIPLKKTVRHASHARRETDSIVVCCRLEDGTEGWGEGLPRPYVTGDTMESIWEQLHRTDLSRSFGDPIESLDDAVERCRAFQLADLPGDHRDSFGHSLRCAVELSVLDAVCRAEDRPLSDVTHLLPEAADVAGRSERVQYSAALTAASPFRERMNAWLFRMYGFRQLKVKVGVDGQDDAATLRRVRRFAGPSMDLRIDANEAWTAANLESKLAPLAEIGITAVEQPLPHDHVEDLAAVRPRLPVPVMLDESLCSLGDAERAIDRGLCDLFNIRLSKCGGFINSLLIAARAVEAGLGFQLGCQVGETGILSAAGRHFACSVAGLRYLEGSFDRHLVRERLTQEDLTFGRGGFASALNEPGLGVAVDGDALQRVCVKEERVELAAPVRS